MNRSFRQRILHRAMLWALALAAVFAVSSTCAIVLTLLYKAIQFFALVPLHRVLFGTRWAPQAMMNASDPALADSFGMIPLFWGTLMITGIALSIAVPLGLYGAIYLAEYAHPRMRRTLKPVLEMLAGVPTVVYGFIAAVTIGPMIRHIGLMVGMEPSSESALAAGLDMGVMLIPFVLSMSEDALRSVPRTLHDAALALGATKAEAVRSVVVGAAMPGIISAILLALSRAVGETMIVVMAAGVSAHMSLNPLESATTFTVQIVTLLVGDQSFDSPKTLAAFGLGIILFCITLVLNMIALTVVRRCRATRGTG